MVLQVQISLPIVNSIFTKLPGDNKRFHKIVDELKNSELKFDPKKHVKIIDCEEDRSVPYRGKAFLTSPEVNLYICGNATWKHFLKNDRKAIHSILLHKLIHLYDQKVQNYNFYSAQDLACTEIRAFNLSDSCDGSRICLIDKVSRTLGTTNATKYMEKEERLQVISSVMMRSIKDESPFTKHEE